VTDIRKDSSIRILKSYIQILSLTLCVGMLAGIADTIFTVDVFAEEIAIAAASDLNFAMKETVSEF